MTPKIDKRSFDDHLRILERAWVRMGGADALGLRAHFLPRWTATQNDAAGLDFGLVLNRLVARLMTELSDHINRIPEKHFAAFLDMIGVERLPGSPARVPVTFTPAPGTPAGRQVPAGTQVATTQTETNPAVAFETEESFELTPVNVVRAVTLDARADTWRDIGEPLLDEKAPAAQAILQSTSADQRVEHSLYLVHDGFFAQEDPQDVTIQFDIATPGSVSGLAVVWERLNEDQVWEALTVTNASAWLTTAPVATVRIDDFTGSTPNIVGSDAQPRPWIRARLDAPLTGLARALPRIGNIQVLSEPPSGGAVPGAFPTSAFANTQPIDLNRDFFPFGDRPQQNDAFYFASPAFHNPQPDKRRTITITLALRPIPGVAGSVFPTDADTAGRAVVAWEYWSSSGRWRSLTTTPGPGTSAADLSFFRANATAFTFSFDLEPDIAERTVNGATAYWIRARIQSGGYTRVVTDHVTVAASPSYNVDFTRLEFRSPFLSITDFDISYTVAAGVDVALDGCVSVNHFSVVDHTDVLGTGAAFAPYRSLADLAAADPTAYAGLADPALYLGYDASFANVRVSQLLVIDAPDAAAFRDEQSVDTPVVVWEYRDGSGRWARLDARDGTRALATSGTIAFTAPADMRASVEFGLASDPQTYWIRGRVAAGSLRSQRQLADVKLNTVWARSLRSRTGEVIGSGNGKRGQTLITVQAPVLRGEVVRVRESAPPDPQALEILDREEEDIAAQIEAPRRAVVETVEPDSPTGTRQYWVRWYPRPNGDASAATDRHYFIDRVSGQVTFPGMPLPVGRDNVRVDYRVNQGERAREAAQRDTVTQLSSSLPYVSEVTNRLAAQGGAGPETALASVLERGPLMLKHGNRAVTWEDLEALAREAEPGLSLVRVLPTTNARGARELGVATLIVVPFSSEPEPQPSPELLDQVRHYLAKRGSETAAHRIYVIGPAYVRISAAVRVIPTDPTEARSLALRVAQALQEFFHPLTGGRNGVGWPFAANVHISDVYARLERVPGVEGLASAAFAGPDPTRVVVPSNQLVSSGTHSVEVVAST